MAALRYSGNVVMRVTVDREKNTYKVSLSVNSKHIRTVQDIIFSSALGTSFKIDSPDMIDAAAKLALTHAQFELYASNGNLNQKNGKVIIERKN